MPLALTIRSLIDKGGYFGGVFAYLLSCANVIPFKIPNSPYSKLVWTRKTMHLTTPFLTQIDPRAKIKGSRDPLGLQPIWTRLGRCVVHNLTTVTTSLRGFSVWLLGMYFTNQAVNERGEDEGNFSALFLKFEQLAAYSRVAWHDKAGESEYSEDEIRGILRVKRNLHEGKGRVWISAEQDGQILANQRTYGLWGLYTVAARNSGWLDFDTFCLTPRAREFVEAEYLSRLGRDSESVFPFLHKDRYFEPRGKDAKLGHSLAYLLGLSLTEAEGRFYSRHLLACDQDDSQQLRLWEFIKDINWPTPFSMPELREIIKCCRSREEGRLAQHLEHIQHVETVIGPAGWLFSFILARDDQAIDDVVREIKSAWGARLAHVEPLLFSNSLSTIKKSLPTETYKRLIALAEAMATGDYRQLIELALEQNRTVMQARGGDAWVKLKAKHLDVRFREDAGELPTGDELPNLWVNSYFINSLKTIGYQIERGHLK
jgi:hypothetical protein